MLFSTLTNRLQCYKCGREKERRVDVVDVQSGATCCGGEKEFLNGWEGKRAKRFTISERVIGRIRKCNVELHGMDR